MVPKVRNVNITARPFHLNALRFESGQDIWHAHAVAAHRAYRHNVLTVWIGSVPLEAHPAADPAAIEDRLGRSAFKREPAPRYLHLLRPQSA